MTSFISMYVMSSYRSIFIHECVCVCVCMYVCACVRVCFYPLALCFSLVCLEALILSANTSSILVLGSSPKQLILGWRRKRLQRAWNILVKGSAQRMMGTWQKDKEAAWKGSHGPNPGRFEHPTSIIVVMDSNPLTKTGRPNVTTLI